jgi:hypothetical protein
LQPAKWLKGLKNNIKRTLFQRALKEGQELDQSCPPVYRGSVEEIVAAYARKGSREAADRKFGILSAYQVPSINKALARRPSVY